MLLSMYIDENQSLREKYIENKVAVDTSRPYAENALAKANEALEALDIETLTGDNEKLLKALYCIKLNLESVCDNLKVGDN